MVSNPYLVVASLAVIVAVLALRAVLWHVVSSAACAWPGVRRASGNRPAWARAVPVRLRARYPRTCAVLNSRLSPATFTGLPLTLMAIAAVYAVVLLGGLIEDLREADSLIRLDQGVNAWFSPYRATWLVAEFIWVTALGAGPATTAVAATASALLWSQGRARMLIPLWITFLGAQGTTWATKYAIGRVRPTFLNAVSAASPSFPSGHAAAATALVGFLAYVIARDLPELRRRFDVAFWAALVIALVCFSRLFLSVHYLSDVAGGILIGAFWLLVGFAIAELQRAPYNQGE
jgi:undecaprenyl-diphosphatase